nr:hypothetical protein [Tanacetum cinerariifolium]
MQMFELFSYLMMKLRKVRMTSWELVMRWMKILRLQYHISLLHLRQTSLNHLMLQTLKHLTLTPLVMIFSRNMTTLSHSLNDDCSLFNIKASIGDYYDENIAHRDHTDKLVEATMSFLDKSNTTNSDLYKGLQIVTELLKEIKNAIKDAPAMNNKINEATETFTKISTNTTKVLSLVKGFNFSDLHSTVKDPQAHALKSRISSLERVQNHIQSNMFSLKEDTLFIKYMMTEMYQVFKGQSSSAPSGSVTPTLALTHIPANVKWENNTNTTTEDPLSHTERETGANKQETLEEPKHSTDANIEFIGSSTP